MSKELEALLDLFNEANRFNNEPYKFNTLELFERKQIIEQALKRLEAIDNAEPSEALESFDYIVRNLEAVVDDVVYMDCIEHLTTIKQALLKAQEREKENELLKEIIKSLFDRGCPLHQYIDKDFGLTIEVDDECSILHLGKYKCVDLDKKLKEVLDNE